MPTLKTNVPRLHRHASGQAFVKIEGKQIYLGRHGAPATQERYDRLVSEWLANHRRLPAPVQTDATAPTLSMVMLEYVKHVAAIHPGNHGDQIKDALRTLRALYGSTEAGVFTPANLEAVRATWIEKALTRSTINRKVNFIRAMFKWAVSRAMLPAAVWQALQSVEGLRKGRTMARESKKVGPVDDHLIEAVRPHVPSPVWALIQLQLLTGARPGELLPMTARDIRMAGEVWTYVPASHKTEHHGHDRTIFIGPKGQEVIRPFLPPARPIDTPLFSPREAAKERKAVAAKGSRRPGQKANAKATDRTIGVCYTNHSYRRCIERAAEKAFPVPAEYQPAKGDSHAVRAGKRAERNKWIKAHRWHPHQLRHNAATAIRKLEGIETARVVLGHSSASTTAIYAEQDQEKAREIILKVG